MSVENKIIKIGSWIHQEKLSENPSKIKIQKWQQERDELLDELKKSHSL